ncbi:hypothetical protein [Jeotgalibacillus proteolyticus]|uniref:hypothetical protein n=1 Tax=Jeotgalibacillus proteolyticus TaxID=2082395 RepID=UPI003CEC3059
MTEMELFVELIDDDEANNILTFFKENPTGARKETATLEQKKIQIKKVFKSMTPNMKRMRRSGGSNPFYLYINKYTKTTDQQGENFKDHLLLLSELNKDVPNYIRFANLLLVYPQETRNKINDFEEIIKQGKNPFKFDEGFQDVDDLKKFIRKFHDFAGKKAPQNVVELLIPFQPDDLKIELEECKDQLKNYDILQYYNERESFYNKYRLPISHMAYIETHPEEDFDILTLLTIEALFDTLKSHSESVKDKIDNAIKNIEEQQIAIKTRLQEKNDEIADFKSDINTISKHNKKLKSEIQTLSNSLKDWEDKYNILYFEQDETTVKHSNEIKKLENKFNKEIRSLEKKFVIQELIENERVNQFKHENSIIIDWGIICMYDFEVIKEIYPEIPLIHAEHNLTSFLNNSTLKTIYLSMNGLSTKKFREIEKEIQLSNKDYIPVDFDNIKEAIEWIGYMKTLIRKGAKI